jgi:hypothetical protein
VHGISGMCILSVSKNVKANAVFFDIFRNEKNAPFTLHFSEVYFGPITGGVFGFFQKEYPEVFFLRFTRVPNYYIVSLT